MKLKDLVPLCVLPTYNEDILFVHKADLGKEMCACMYMDRNFNADKPVMMIHQAQMFLARSAGFCEIEQTRDNIDFFLERLEEHYTDDYITKTLVAFGKFRKFHNAVWLKDTSRNLLEYLETILEERDAMCKDYDRFYELMNRYPAEPETEDMDFIDAFYDKVEYTNEEIIFMANYAFNFFAAKFPGLCEYYMQCLD